MVYQVVQQHLETWLARMRAAEPDGDPIPPFVERDLRQYLERRWRRSDRDVAGQYKDVRFKCGILAHGFARVRCSSCGHDFLMAFSCKGRGVCPLCNTRRMAETAAHLVDHVFPQVPVRQWVLALPKRLRYFLHHDPDLVGRVLQLFLQAVEGRLKSCSPSAPASSPLSWRASRPMPRCVLR